MTCDDCLHKPICMEQRGICTEYKTLEMIKNDIEMLNANYTKTSAGSGANTGTQGPAQALDRTANTEAESREGI